MIKSLFVSAPYPGKQKFGGQPTGLLYALSVTAKKRKNAKENIKVWCPEGISNKREEKKFERELIGYIKENKPKILGVSTFSVSYKNALDILRIAKEASPETVVVFGGAHEDNFVKYYRERNSVDADFDVAGDGMFVLDKLYEIIENNSSLTVEDIKNKVSESKNEFSRLKGAGLLLYNKDKQLREIKTSGKPISLDKVPIMPRYLLEKEDETSKSFTIFNGEKTAQIMIGQGCPHSCAFCSEGIKRVWYDDDSPKSVNFIKSLSKIEKEIKSLKKQGYSAIFFDDSTFLAKSKNYLEKLFDMLKKYELEWGCQTTQLSICLNKELLSKMKESGCSYAYIGVEHFDGEMRDAFGNNKYGIVSTESTIELLKNQGIRVGISLTFGHPDEADPKEATKENVKTAKYAIDKTADLIKNYENLIGVSLNLITYQPGTIYSERYEKKFEKIPFTEHPNDFGAFRKFEEGIGPHAKGITSKLAKFILDYAKDRIGDKLFI
jgi:radical SAM superfamily enzyme YgiQ (UPF0313 family)